MDNKQKIVKTLLIIGLIMLVFGGLFLSVYFVLNHQASVCDPVYEIKRAQALSKASKNFLYLSLGFIPTGLILFVSPLLTKKK